MVLSGLVAASGTLTLNGVTSIGLGATLETLSGGTALLGGTIINSGTLFASGADSFIEILGGATINGGGIVQIGDGVVDIQSQADTENVVFVAGGTGGLEIDDFDVPYLSYTRVRRDDLRVRSEHSSVHRSHRRDVRLDCQCDLHVDWREQRRAYGHQRPLGPAVGRSNRGADQLRRPVLDVELQDRLRSGRHRWRSPIRRLPSQAPPARQRASLSAVTRRSRPLGAEVSWEGVRRSPAATCRQPCS